MKFPKMKPQQTLFSTWEAFGGYDCRERIPEGSFCQMRNMTSDHYPVLSPREKRGEADHFPAGMTGAIVKGGICYTLGSRFCLPGGQEVELDLREGEKQLVSMGAYVIILPDKKWVNVAACLDALEKGEAIPEDAYGPVDRVYHGSAEFHLCKEDGQLYKTEDIANTKPTDPQDEQLWMDISEGKPVLKKWIREMNEWAEVSNVYTRMRLEENLFSPGDTVEISGFDERGFLRNVTGLQYVIAAGVSESEPGDPERPYIVIRGLMENTTVFIDAVSVTCTMPDMDLVIESGNRLWGCKYGSTENGFLNEIYASKLGDFKNWNSFRGISTDSYTASIGEGGPFTGAVNYGGRPYFFKENCLIEVYGGYPAQYRVQTTPCDGVRAGCEKSTALVDNVLYYRSASGICAFDGSLPVQVGKALGSAVYEHAVAGGCGSKYYISMEDEAGWHLFVYDTARKLWHREDELQAKGFYTYRNRLYCLAADGTFFAMSDPEGSECVSWMATTGPIGLSLPGSKYVSRLNLRLCVEPGAGVSLSVRYDHSPRWEPLYAVTGTDLNSFTIPIRPKRCDHMALKLEGTGKVKIYSLTQCIEKGSDVL